MRYKGLRGFNENLISTPPEPPIIPLVVLNGLVRFLVAIYCTQILFQIFRNPIRPCHAPGNSCLISRSNSQRLENFGIKKDGTCRATRNDWKPQSSARFKFGPFDSNRSVLVQKRTLWEKLPSPLPRHFTRFTPGRM